MKCDKCKNKPWKECCNDCEELEYCCYISKNIIKAKIILNIWETIMIIQINILRVICGKFTNMFLSLGLEREDPYCTSILIDIDIHIPKTGSRIMLKGLI